MIKRCLFLAVALMAPSMFAETNFLPAPRGDEVDITRILAARRDTTAFATNGLARQDLSDILWASTGINRPATGHRTANYSFKSRDNEIYLLCEQGVFVYDQIEHALVQESAVDLRSTLPAPADSAPVSLAHVTYSSSPSFFGAIHTGFVAENVALACADLGLGARLTADIPERLHDDLGLASSRHLLILQTIGFPAGAVSNVTSWTVKDGPLVAATVSDTPALKILKRRRSTRSFSSEPFSDQTLGELLWAGAGVNHFNTLERTSPLITNGVYDIDIYVARSNGVFVYRPAFGDEHGIEKVSESDIRGSFGYGSVPAIFIYVADYSKQPSSQKACLHAGFVSQNIAAYAAAEGIGELVRSSVSDVSGTMGLTADQDQLFTQTLGYPAALPGASTISFAAGEGGRLVGSTSQNVAFGSNCTAVVAVPETNRYFGYWDGLPGGRVLSNPLMLTDATTPMTVTAVFTNRPCTYAGWASAFFTASELTNSAISSSSADPSGSGLCNFERYAFNLSPQGPAALSLSPCIATNGEGRCFAFSFCRRSNAVDLCYQVEASSNLVDWVLFETFYPGSPTNVTVWDSAPISDPSAPDQRFLRLRAVLRME